ncbi:hypothetical protein AB0N76_39755, partial [Kitasatospora sp. NPDC093806]
MRIRPIMLITATAATAAIAAAGGMATAATGTPTSAPTVHAEPTAATPTAATAPSTPAAAVSSAPASPRPAAAFTVTDTATTPIDAGAVAGILASCLGADASKYHAVIAVRTPVASADTDGVVVAVDSAGQYVQCESKGDKGTSSSVPPTFINDRLWGAGHLIEFFDSFS